MIVRLLLVLILVTTGVSCRSTQRLVKAFPAEPSSFLINRQALVKTNAAKSPFLRDWRNPNPKAWTESEKHTHIYIAPVSIEHLRPMTRTLSKIAVSEESRQKNVRKLADYFHEEIVKSFTNAPAGSLQVVSKADADSLLLEVAIIEFNPNSMIGGLVRKGINILLWPGAETAVSHKLKGYMAIEGRLKDPKTKEVLYEFADAEQNRSGIILYVHDYTTYTYFRKASREWAKQIEAVIRSQAASSVKDGPAATLLLW